jgi:hypothetical protein
VKDPNNKNNNRKKFACPFCPHRSSREWNMQVHIKRWHDGIGHPIETTSSSASSIADKQFAPSVNSTEIWKNIILDYPIIGVIVMLTKISTG